MNTYSTTPNRNTATLISSSPRHNPIKHSPPYAPLLQHMAPSTFSFMPSNNTPSSHIKQSPPYSSKIPSTNNLKQSPPYTSKTHNDSTSSSDASPGGNRSRSFSITDILADNNTTSSVSRKRTSPSESSVSSQEKTPRVVASEGGLLSPTSTATPVTTGGEQQQQSLLSLMQASGVVMSPINACLPVSPALCQSTTGPYQNQVAGYFHPLSMLASTHAPPSAQSFFPTTLSGVSQQMRGGAQQTGGLYSVLPNQLQENMADMKLASSQLDDSGTADSIHDASNGSIDEESTANVNGRNGNRSALRKLDINEHAPNTNNTNSNVSTTPVNTTPKSSVRYNQHQQPSHTAPPPYLPNYISWSPLQLPNPAATFSPSIFLTCPSGPLPPSSVVHPVPRSSPQDLSSPDEKIGGVVGGANSFMTSTPIRRGDRIQLVSPSRVHSPIANGSGSKRGSRIQQQQVEQNTSSNEHNSSASDSEMPLLHRPRVPRRRPPKARTSLNPLLENTNPSPSATSPPTRPSLPPPSAPPSSLLTSYKLSSQQYPSFSDSGIVPDSSSSMLYRSSYGPLMSPVGHYQHQQKTPVKGRLDRGGGGGAAYGRILCGSSPVTDHLNKTGQIQSVPPWFICSDKKSDGKRLRLTEAINKSLSESVTQKHHQLPAEWQKLAYGQTEDQKSLTRKARNFLKGRPRVLKFDGTGSGSSSSSCNNKKKVSQ
ncbi:PREDICTED: mucin-17-like [Amphimedon queenslandica]|uniref:Uncharacterized protein n=1 Tax=Amphimedon queenslandica TaxID=400682 RepID=A0A1X7VHY8_AMPQE|nr:PREDICTED: mucin-17-like [Amphimedon queenslandica]|eukprot:XP_019848866.1 PREDICTED: mucin-17-like [Amphimedon queenslandica]